MDFVQNTYKVNTCLDSVEVFILFCFFKPAFFFILGLDFWGAEVEMMVACFGFLFLFKLQLLTVKIFNVVCYLLIRTL